MKTRRTGLLLAQLLIVIGLIMTLNKMTATASVPSTLSPPSSNASDQGAAPIPQSPQSGETIDANVAAKIQYQGVLEVNGVPLDGWRTMEFHLFANASCTGTPLYAYTAGGVQVIEGIFSVEIPVGSGYFNGQGRWLRVKVGSLYIGCEEILPVPYAYNLRPGAAVTGNPTAWNGWVLKADMQGTNASASAVLGETATGFAVKGNSTNGTALYGITDNGYAVYGFDSGTLADRGYGGMFISNNGIGIAVTTNSASHYNHAGIFNAYYGYGIYANSTENNGIRAVGGDPGDLNQVWTPGGAAGVVGLSGTKPGVWGSSRESQGVFGISYNSYGVYGSSTSDYAGYFYSHNYRGVYGSSASGEWAGVFANRSGAAQPGLSVTGWTSLQGNTSVVGNITATGSKAGYVVDVAQNTGIEPLETGDVVVITGAGTPVLGEIPLILVRKADGAASPAVAGVVDQRVTLISGDEIPPGDEQQLVSYKGTATQALKTAINEGENLTIVTLGSFKAIKVDASYGAITAGDILVSSPNPGYAMRTDTPQYGTIVGKALGDLSEGTGVIPVLVTLD